MSKVYITPEGYAFPLLSEEAMRMSDSTIKKKTANELVIQDRQPGAVEYRRLEDGTIQIREHDNGDEWRTIWWMSHHTLGYVFSDPNSFGPFVDWLRKTPGRIKLKTDGQWPGKRKTLVIEIISYEEE